MEKRSESRLSYLFAHLHLLSSYSFSSTLLSSDLSLLSASALLCFSSVHIVGSLTSKLPSTKLAETRSSTTVYYKACAHMFQYYRILQSLRTHVPVLPYTTKLAQTRGFIAASRTRFCSFPHRHGDVCAAKHTRFCSLPRGHGINDATTMPRRRENDAPTNWRRTRVQPPDPSDYKREPFATHSGKNVVPV